MSNQTVVMDDQFVAYRVRVELDRKERSTRELARELDMTHSSMQRRMCGQVPFSATQIARVAQALDVEVSVFFPPRSLAGTQDQPDDHARDNAEGAERPALRRKHGRSVGRGGRQRGPVSGSGRGPAS